MKIHEYQAKELFNENGIAVPAGIAATSVEEAVQAAESLKESGSTLIFVKAQIHAGGRGKGRTKKNNAKGVILCKTVEEVREAAESLLGDVLVTLQTGEEGQEVKTIYITDGVDIEKEFYLGILLDRANSKNVIMVSTEGGVEIEEVAAETPEKTIKERVEPGMDLAPSQARRLAFALGLEGGAFEHVAEFSDTLANVDVGKDADMVEIDPLVRTADGDLLALDAKVTCDGDALDRHKETAELRDTAEENAVDLEAS